MGLAFSTSAPSRELKCGARGIWASTPPPIFVAMPPPDLPLMPGYGGSLDLQAAASIFFSCTRIIFLREGWSGQPSYFP